MGEAIAALLLFVVGAGILRGSSGWRLFVGVVQAISMGIAVYTLVAHHVGGYVYRSVFSLFLGVFVLWALYGHKESDRFFEVVRSKAEVFSPIDLNELQKAYLDLSEVMITDPEDGKRLALECVARVKGIPNHAELVKSAAEIAAAADGRLDAIEESVMQDVRGALGL